MLFACFLFILWVAIVDAVRYWKHSDAILTAGSLANWTQMSSADAM